MSNENQNVVKALGEFAFYCLALREKFVDYLFS